MNQLIQDSGRERRGPHIPVVYEQACAALQACLNIDEAREWADKSEALAAWAKIHHDNDASVARHGLSASGSEAARRLALMSEDRFNRYSNSSHPPSPNTLSAYGKGSSPEWVVFKIAFSSFSGACGRHEPHKMAAGLTPVEAGWARAKARLISDWLDEFERRLPE